DETRASMSGGMFRAIATVHCTIIISTNTPRPNDATHTAGSGSTIASDSGEMATAPPMTTTNSIGRRGVKRSAAAPPAIAPQAAGPPRCSRATTGPSTENAPYQAIITSLNWATITHSQVWDRN